MLTAEGAEWAQMSARSDEGSTAHAYVSDMVTELDAEARNCVAASGRRAYSSTLKPEAPSITVSLRDLCGEMIV